MKKINKYTLSLITVIVSITALYQMANSKSFISEEQINKNEIKNKKIDNENQNYIKETKIQKVLNTKQAQKYEIYKENNYCQGFESITISEAKEISMPKRKIEPISAFKLCDLNLKTLRNGDTITLPLVNNNEYTAKVKRKIKNTNGSTTIMANLEDQGRNYYSVITEGRDSLLITLVSPEGTYEMEYYDNIGYIYSSNDINNSMIDYKKTDAIEVHKHQYNH